MQLIVYQQRNGEIAIVMPTSELPVEEVAKKDVPAGVPYLIVDQATLPADWEYSSAWEADFSQPHGTGLGHEGWEAQYVDPMASYEQAHIENAQFDMLKALKQSPQTFACTP